MGVRRGIRVGVIGVGKMGEAIVKGLLASRRFRPADVRVADKDTARSGYVSETYGVAAEASNRDLVKKVDVCVLAVKPQDIETAIEGIRGVVPKQCLIVSIVAGITTGWLQDRLGQGTKVVRAMPNAAALVGMAATGLVCGAEVTPKDAERARSIFDCLGTTILVRDEDHLNVITGLSGSGPAYVFLLLEALVDAGVYLGLSREVSVALCAKTLQGAAEMAVRLETPVPLLKEMVTSPGGTTMAGLRVLEEGKFRGTVLAAVEAATRRSRELAR
jgi:pyrroline-5-carboxylate reductase